MKRTHATGEGQFLSCLSTLSFTFPLPPSSIAAATQPLWTLTASCCCTCMPCCHHYELKKKEKCIMIFLIVAFFILKPPVEAQSSQSTCSVHADWGYSRLICTPTRLHQELYEYMSRSLVLPAHSWMWWLDTEKWLTSRWRCSHINLLWLFERPSQTCGQISTWNAN